MTQNELDDGGPFFPAFKTIQTADDSTGVTITFRDPVTHQVSRGCSVRDYFAAAAIKSSYPWDFSKGNDGQQYFDNIAKTAYAIADAMLRTRRA